MVVLVVGIRNDRPMYANFVCGCVALDNVCGIAMGESSLKLKWVLFCGQSGCFVYGL